MWYLSATLQSCTNCFVVGLFYNLITQCLTVGDETQFFNVEPHKNVPQHQKVILLLREVESDMVQSGVIRKGPLQNEKHILRNNSQNSDIIHLSRTTGFNSIVSVNRDGLVNYTQSKTESSGKRVKRQNSPSKLFRLPNTNAIKQYAENIPHFYENFFRSLRLLPFISVFLDKKLGRIVGSSASRRILRNRQLDVNNHEESYCFGEIGCFTITKEFYHPIIRPLNVPPEDRATIDTRFIFFTRAQRSGINIDPRNLQVISTTTFDGSRPTKFIIHGWRSSGARNWIQDMLSALLQHGDYNVVVVDWTRGASLFFSFVLSNALVVALEVSSLLKWLQENTALSMSNVHIIGHSLGAQISGYVGQRTPGIGRITGLDPARPFFQGMPESVRLDPSDASFVDVIHTDSHPDPYAGGHAFGTGELSGHLDFFPNGGNLQPDCELINLASLGYSCSHSFAYFLFTASIRSTCPFLAFPCNNYRDFKLGKCFSCDGPSGCALMGINADTWQPMGRKQVAMYLTTSGQPDYCQYHYRLVLHLPAGRVPGAYVFGHLNVVLKSQNGQSKSFRLTDSGPVRLELGTSPSFLLRHRGDHSSSDVALLSWRPVRSLFRPCTGLCVADLKVSHLTLTPLDNASILMSNSSSVVMCDPGLRHSQTIRSRKVVRFQASPSCSRLQL